MEHNHWNEEEECSETDVYSIALTGMLLAGVIIMVIGGFIPLLKMIF